MALPKTRAITSVGPPGENPTTNVIGLVGYFVWAATLNGSVSNTPMSPVAKDKSHDFLFMKVSIKNEIERFAKRK
jgi:hypothetical protein